MKRVIVPAQLDELRKYRLSLIERRGLFQCLLKHKHRVGMLVNFLCHRLAVLLNSICSQQPGHIRYKHC